MTTYRPLADDYRELSDEEIVARVVAGEVALFEILMRRNNTRVYRTIRPLARDDAEAEDAMQAAYVGAFAKLASFRGEARFSTWLTQVALNEVLGRRRRDHRHPSISLALVEEPAVSTPSPELAASRRELAEVLERAVRALPETYRIVFVLREMVGLDTAETAATLAVTDDVVKTRLTRARAFLRQHLEELADHALADAFDFEAPRCDRVVAQVMRQILP
jgi:RNA polymerase sigma-70 factor (ECF subfamily)